MDTEQDDIYQAFRLSIAPLFRFLTLLGSHRRGQRTLKAVEPIPAGVIDSKGSGVTKQ